MRVLYEINTKFNSKYANYMNMERDVLLTHLLAKEYNSLQFTNNNASFPSPLNIQSKTAFMRILLPSYIKKSPSNTKLSSATLLFSHSIEK